jgi:hypothetical protein
MLRRLICCVLAIEIAEHERRAVFDQIRITQALRALLAEGTAALAPQDVIAIPRENGALVAFTADPAACFRAALGVREAFLHDERGRDLQPRIGIDLGPVELLEEEPGQAYLGGEGRRDAERLMRQAPPGQVSVTRSFFELLARAAPDLAARLTYKGLMTDAVGRPLGWYAIDTAPDRRAQPPSEVAPAAGDGPERRWRRLRFGLLPIAVLAAVLVPASPWRAPETRTSGRLEPVAIAPLETLAQPVSEVPVTDARALDEVDAMPILRETRPQTARPARDERKARALTRAVPAGRAGTVQAQASPGPDLPPKTHAPRADLVQDDAPGMRGARVTVRLAVRPWGEVQVEGQRPVLTPPVKALQLAPGRYTIRIVNGSLPPYRRELVVPAGTAPVTLAHDFSCVATRDHICPEAVGTPQLASARLRPRTARDRDLQPLAIAGRAGRPELARTREGAAEQAAAAVAAR